MAKLVIFVGITVQNGRHFIIFIFFDVFLYVIAEFPSRHNQ